MTSRRKDARMRGSVPAVDRRTALRALGLLGGLALAPGCAAGFADTRLRMATGPTEGGYFTVGTTLAQIWHRELGLSTVPRVLATAGSTDNLRLLDSGGADLVFCQVDVAADRAACCSPDDPTSPRALARIYDDVVHVVVPAASAIRTMDQLRGARVSFGGSGSGAQFVARRLLQAADLDADTDMTSVQLGISESSAALAAGDIDAFFWAGSLPTQGISTLAAQLTIRLLDLADVVGRLRVIYPEYSAGTIPAGSYGIPQPVTSLMVRNVLLVRADTPDLLAEALVEALFSTQDELARSSRAALTMDPRAAIGTQPLLLHPGAERFYRRKDTF